MINIKLPFPPSINHYWKHLRSSPRVYISKEGLEYRKIVSSTMQDFDPIGQARLSVKIVIHAPNKRKFDIDNRIKSLFDAITHSGLWDDDEQVDEIHIYRGDIQKNDGCVFLSISTIL